MSQATVNGSVSIPAEELAQLARLKYVSDCEDGILRQRNGRGFVYLFRGKKIRNRRLVERIERLAIPPAWREVWICGTANGHLQATGRDDRNRKQYLYHSRWRETADLAKFARIEEFGRVLPRLRTAIARDLAGRSLTAKRVLGGMLAILDLTSIRIGNEEYARENKSYGLTTLRNRHVVERGLALELRFSAKGGFRRSVTISDAKLVRLLNECRALRGAHVFQYPDETGSPRAVDAGEVNDYLRELTKQPFTAKDFRTWKASALGAGVLYAHRDVTRVAPARRVIKEAIAVAAETLGNTTTVCRKYYIHPGLFEAFESGRLQEVLRGFRPSARGKYTPDEQILRRFLKHWRSSTLSDLAR